MAVDQMHIVLEGRMLEALLDKALKQGVQFQRVYRAGARQMEVSLSSVDGEYLQGLAERAGVLATVTAYEGLSKYLRLLKRRWSLGVALTLGAALLVAMSMVLWSVEVLAADEEEQAAALSSALSDQVYETLLEMGIRPGVWKGGVDTVQAGLHIENVIPEIAFAGVSVEGTRLQVRVKPEVAAPPVYDMDSVGDLYAARDGIVEEIQVLAGVAMVKRGDIVRQGELLIRGEEKISGEGTRRIRALGTVTARTFYQSRIVMGRRYTVLHPTGNSGYTSELRLFDHRHLLLEGPSYEKFQSYESELPVGGLFLPLKIHRVHYEELEEKQMEMADEELTQRAERLALSKVLSLCPLESRIVDKWIDYGMIENGDIRATAVIEALESIATFQPAIK